MRVAWQTYIVHVIVLFNVLVALIAANVTPLGVNNPWITLIAIPFAVASGTYAANQLKPIGGNPPNTN